MAQIFGKFLLGRKIGQGGMAEVYRAQMRTPEGPVVVAVKRLGAKRARSPSMIAMFTTEADIGRMLNHRNLVRVYESGLVDNEPYIAMASLVGLDLAPLLLARRRLRVPVPQEIAILVTEEILRALDYVHGARACTGARMGIIHRDVTPENV